jgi:hypothetical protein
MPGAPVSKTLNPSIRREAGVHVKALTDLMEHSSISITGDVYGHTSDDTARSAVDGWNGVLGR